MKWVLWKVIRQSYLKSNIWSTIFQQNLNLKVSLNYDSLRSMFKKKEGRGEKEEGGKKRQRNTPKH